MPAHRYLSTLVWLLLVSRRSQYRLLATPARIAHAIAASPHDL